MSAFTCAPRASTNLMSGMIRSTPSWSGSGNITPASMRIVVSSHDTAIMFMPNSPRPPSGTISSAPGDTAGTAIWFIRIPAGNGSVVLTAIEALAGRNAGLLDSHERVGRQAAGSAWISGRLNDFRGKTIAQRARAVPFQGRSGFQVAWKGQVLLFQLLEPPDDRGRRRSAGARSGGSCVAAKTGLERPARRPRNRRRRPRVLGT